MMISLVLRIEAADPPIPVTLPFTGFKPHSLGHLALETTVILAPVSTIPVRVAVECPLSSLQFIVGLSCSTVFAHHMDGVLWHQRWSSGITTSYATACPLGKNQSGFRQETRMVTSPPGSSLLISGTTNSSGGPCTGSPEIQMSVSMSESVFAFAEICH